MPEMQRIVVGISGASGAAIGVRLVERLAALEGIEVHLVISTAGERTLAHEVGPSTVQRLARLAHRLYDISDIGASIASGSFRTSGMVVAPCSMRTLGAIVASQSDNLLVRAADVHLKERRRLVLLTRETPLHLGHLRSMCVATELGAIVMPPVPAFYLLPKNLDEVVDQIAARAIDVLDLHVPVQALAWQGEGSNAGCSGSDTPE